MKRYSYLYGTTWVSEKAALESGARGHIANVGESEKLRPFLLKQGAADAALVMTTVQNMLGGIVMHGMHKENLPQVSPMSVRFAPMYLHRREDMPNNMKPLNAICISGFENRDNNRNGTYSHTVFMPLADLRGDEQFNYLDVLFGTHRTTWQDMLDHVMSKDDFFIDCDAMPVKVTPILDERDMKQVIYAAAALYAGRSVIIRAENRYEFNDRAWNILTQIFSLLNPHILAEVGFSTYDTPDRIRQLVKDTGIRLFVTTQDKSPEELLSCADIVIDMESADIYGEESVAPPAQVLEAVQYWYGLPWDARRNILDAQMKDVMLFQNGIPFAEATAAFAADPFHQWCNDESVEGTVTSLAQLQEIYRSFPICAKIPMMHELFAARVPELLPENVTLSDLAAKTYDAYRHAKKAEEKEKHQALYEFALELGQIDAPPVAEEAAATERRIGKENLETLRKAAQQELDEKDRDHEAAMQEAAATAAAVLSQTKEAHAQAMEAADTKFRQAEEDHAQAMEKVKTAARTAVEAEQTKAREELAAQQAKAAEELAAQQAKADQAIAEEQNKRAESERQAMESLRKLQGEKETVEQDLQTVKDEKAELDTKLSVTVEALSAKEQEAAGLTEQLQQEKANSADLTVKLERKTQEYDQAQETIRQNQEEAEKILAEEKEKHIKTKKAYRHMKEQYENAVGTAEFKDAKRKQLIAAGLGFGVAALILGAVLLIVLLVGRGDAAPTTPSGTTTAPTTVVTTAPTTAPTTEPTTAPTTEPPTEPPTEPTEHPVVLPEWSEELAAELEQELADKGLLMYGEAADSMDQTMQAVLPEEYSVIAAFMRMQDGTELDLHNFFMILQVAQPGDEEEVVSDEEATQEETVPATTEPETTEPATGDAEQTQEEAEAEKTLTEKLWDYCQRDGVPMMLATDRYAVLIQGDAEIVDLAKAVFARLVGEGESVFTGVIVQPQEQVAE